MLYPSRMTQGSTAGVVDALKELWPEDVGFTRIEGPVGKTIVRAVIHGSTGKRSGGKAPTLAMIGRLGSIGARPEMIGLMSNEDRAVAAVAVAIKLATMEKKGDALPGDVIVATHMCPNAPTQPHEPVPFMGYE